MNTKPLHVLVTGALALSLAVGGAGPASAHSPLTPTSLSLSAELVAGAAFTTVADLGVAGSETYFYTPSDPYDPAPMMTPVILVYSDTGYESEDAALQSLGELGLVDLAEAERAVLIVQNPVGETWGEDDTAVYEGILAHIWGANSDGLPISYFRMTYMIGEGAGATFINEHMTQEPYANRIAGVAIFGGEMPGVEPGLALPAYIVGGTPQAIDYYKTVNDVDTRDGNRFYDSGNVAKEVTVIRSAGRTFSAEQLGEAYHSLFRYTVRQALETTPWSDFTSTEDYTLMRRPNLEDLSLTQTFVSGADTGDTGLSLWYEWAPDEAIDAAASGSGEEFPLVLSMHGGNDHEVFEAESNGWVDLAGEERFVLVAPRHDDAASLMRLIDVIKAKYPIDDSRVYLTGFSGGGRKTWQAASRHPDAFAAVAPMNSPGIEGRNTEGFNYELFELAESTDLPVYFQIADNDPTPSLLIGDTQPVNELKEQNVTAVNQFKILNEIEPASAPDYTTHPYWGFDMEPYREYEAYGFTITTGTLDDDEGVPMMQFGMAHGLNHTHYAGSAAAAWDFLSDFSRDPATNETVYAPDVAVDLDVELDALLTCVGPNTRLTVEVANAEDVPVSADITSEFGTASIANLQPGKDRSARFTVRDGDVGGGEATVLLSAVVGGEEVTEIAQVPFDGITCD